MKGGLKIKEFALAFIPIFVAVDAIGVLPIFISLTEEFSKAEKRKIIILSVFTANTIAIMFIFLGKALFKFLHISISDFLIAGGIILFCIAILELLKPGKKWRIPAEGPGAVPIGTPMIVGPAVLTTTLIVIEQSGTVLTLVAVVLNILIAGIVFMFSDRLIKVLGLSGSRALSKIMMLFMAAIAVRMIRRGFFLLLEAYL